MHSRILDLFHGSLTHIASYVQNKNLVTAINFFVMKIVHMTTLFVGRLKFSR